MKKTLTIVFALVAMLCVGSTSLQAQNSYTSSVGLRFGYPTSVTYKFSLTENNYIEGFAGYRRWSSAASYFNVAAGYQIHKDLSEDIQGLKWYYGVGASARFWNFDSSITDADSFGLAALGFLGLDYAFDDMPLNISIDWVPGFRILGYGSGFAGGQGALSARYILSR